MISKIGIGPFGVREVGSEGPGGAIDTLGAFKQGWSPFVKTMLGFKFMIYLDNNATTETLPEVREAMFEAMCEAYPNPSSAHPGGKIARLKMLDARESLASLLGAEPEQLFFTSGGTEGNNTVLSTLLFSQPTRLVTTQIEHSSILKYAEILETRGVEVVFLPVDSEGLVSLEALREALATETTLVSVQWVNNETGVIQPIEQICAICREHGALFHTDAAQATGKIPIVLSELPVDFATITGHKFHGPLGVGALFVRQKKLLSPLLYGGPQEGGMRAGTENVPAIVGLGKAAELRLSRMGQLATFTANLRDSFEDRVLSGIPEVSVNGSRSHRVGNTTNLQFGGVDGEALVARLGQEGVMCSQSSACTNQRPEPSYVLQAMGLSEDEAYSSIRFSFGALNTEKEAELAAGHLASLCAILRNFRL